MTGSSKQGKSSRPIFHTCPGNSAPARVADEIADRIVELGHADRVPDDDEGIAMAEAAARDGRQVISLNGCGSACSLRALVAAGVVDVRSIGINDLQNSPAWLQSATDADREQLVVAALHRLGIVDGKLPESSPAAASWRSNTPDDYLRAIWLLASPNASAPADCVELPVLAAAIARHLGVSRPSAGQMITRLESLGHVARGERREVLLTDAGRDIAERVIRRHRITERFLFDVVRCDLSDVYGQASTISATADRRLIERFEMLIGDATRCPHGWPFDPQHDRDEMRGLVKLSSLPAQATATIVRLPGPNVETLCMLGEFGFACGAQMLVDAQGSRAVVVAGSSVAPTGEWVPLVRLDGVFVRT